MSATMLRHSIILIVICFTGGIIRVGDGYRILGIFPAPSISHQIVFRALMMGLNKAGHEVVVITPNPTNDPTLKNYTEIDTSFTYKNFKVNHFENRANGIHWMEWFDAGSDLFAGMSAGILGCPEVQKLHAPDSKEKFDLVIVEMHYWPSLFTFAHRFDAPLIGISSLDVTMNAHYAIGNPIMSSDVTNWELDYMVSGKLSFWQRLEAFITTWTHLYRFRTGYIDKQQALAEKYFGNEIPHVTEIENNISLVLVNCQFPITFARPYVPKVVMMGGLHLAQQFQELPNNLKKILDDATDGFIYMSLGSNAKSALLSNQTLEAIKSAFSRLPYTVLWKYEEDFLPGKPDNVYTMKWFPQQAVLAHPNLKVFVYQGGLQSTEEAITNAVPVIGLPVLSDQDLNVDKMVALGTGKKLEITKLDADEFFQAITTVASDKRYKQNMIYTRTLMNDKSHDALENAIWWMEYVIRHKGARHLHSTTADLPWYQRQDMDIVAFITAGLVLILNLVLVILYQLLKVLISRNVKPVEKKIRRSKKLD